MKSKMIDLTDKDFDFFKQTCKFWINLLGLVGWDILYSFHDLKEDVFGNISYNIDSRKARIRLNSVWPIEEYCVDQIRQTAFHEVMELLLGRIKCLGEFKYTREDEINEEIHNLIRIMENVFLPKFSQYDTGQADIYQHIHKGEIDQEVIVDFSFTQNERDLLTEDPAVISKMLEYYSNRMVESPEAMSDIERRHQIWSVFANNIKTP